MTQSVILLLRFNVSGGGNMKRSAKLISVVLIAAMLIATVSCAKRRKGAERIQDDGYAKQEAGLETDQTDPTETEPTQTDPDLPTPTPTPTPANTNKGRSRNFTVKEILTFAESVCGMTPEYAAINLAILLEINDYTTFDSDETDSGGPVHRYMRYLDKDIVCEDIVFKSISLHMKGGRVFSVDYSMRVEGVFTQNEELDSERVNKMFTIAITTKYGQPIDGYTETWVDFNKSGITGWKDGDFIISMFWGKGCQGVDGNDQLVLGVENTGDITPKPTDPVSGGISDGTYTAEYMFVTGIVYIGCNRNSTKLLIETTFATTIGDPVNTKKLTSSSSFTTYIYECKIAVDGVEFNEVEIKVDDDTGIVYQVHFINNKDDANKLASYQQTFADKLSSLYGKTLTDDNNGNAKIQVCKLERSMYIESGSYIDGTDDYFWIAFYTA